MGFSNPIIGGGGALVYPRIKSPDYVPGVSGWSINKDGTVEFNNGTFRGIVTAGEFVGATFIINQTGTFYYSGTPGLGNLIASDGPTIPGVDQFGNLYIPGFATYDATGQSSLTGGALSLLDPANGHLVGQVKLSTGGVRAFYLSMNPAYKLMSDAINAVDPNSGNPETWHAMSLINSWVNSGGGEVTAQYQKVSSPPNSVDVIGRITHAAIAGASVFWTVDPDYIPNNSQIFGLCCINAATNVYAAATTQPKLRVTGSALEFVGLPAGTTDVSFSGNYSLDA